MRWPLPLAIAAAVLLLAGCRTRQAETRTEYRYITQRDSVRVERWDTIRVEVKGDTVRIYERLTEREFYSTVYRDTLRQSDTLRIERTTVEKKQCRNGRFFATGIASGAAMLAIIIAAIHLIKFIKRRL